MPSSLSSCETPWLQTIKGAMSEDDFQRLCTGNMLKPVAKMLEKLDESKKISKTLFFFPLHTPSFSCSNLPFFIFVSLLLFYHLPTSLFFLGTFLSIQLFSGGGQPVFKTTESVFKATKKQTPTFRK